MQTQGFSGEDITPVVAEEEERSDGPEDAPSSTVQGKKNPPEQRRRIMSDRFMMFTYKIKMCRRQDLHNWRLCPYAHPGEAGKRRPPHAYQAVMCDFSKTRKECSHGEACLLARNALEYWLHPDKYRTILCGHGEACNRNICFFAHNQQELRMPASQSGGVPGAGLDPATAAAEAFQQLSIGHPGAGSSSQATAGQQLVYAQDPTAGMAYQAAGAGGLQQPMQAVKVMGAGGAQQVFVPVQVIVAEEQQQMPLGVTVGLGGMPAAAGLQYVQYQQPVAAGGTLQASSHAPSGLMAAGAEQSGVVAVGHPDMPGQPQVVQQRSQQGQPGIVAQGSASGSGSQPGGQVLLQQQPIMQSQGWADVAAAQYQGSLREGGGMARASYYGMPIAGQMMVPTMQHMPQVQPAQHTYFQPQQTQMVMYAPANPGAAAPQGGQGAGAMGYAPSHSGLRQVQIILSQQPGGTHLAPAAVHAGSGMVQAPVLPNAPLEPAAGHAPPPMSAAANPNSGYGPPQQW